MLIEDIDESYSRISFKKETDSEAIDLRVKLMEDLSVFVEGYKFTPGFRSGNWDGKKYFFTVDRDLSLVIPKGLSETISKRYNKFLEKNYSTRISPKIYSEEEIQNHIKSLNLPFTPYDYQVDALREVLENPRRVLQSATGSGKSMIIYIMMTFFMKQNKKGILIVPNVGLVEQMKNDFIEYGMESLEENVHIIYAGKKRTFHNPITITTWQSGILMNSSDYEQLDYVLVDECHLATGDSLTKLINNSKNCLYKIGLTGTLPNTHEGRFSLVATLGKTKKIITPQGLIERGLATPVKIITVYLNYSEEDKKKVRKLKKFREEIDFLSEHLERNKFISKLVVESTKKFGNSILMYNTLSHGNFLLELILKNKFEISNPIILEKVTKKRIESLKINKNNIMDVFLLTSPSKRELNVLKNLFSDEEIDSIRILEDYHIYLIKGSIEGERRDLIRSLLENVDDGIILGSSQTISTGTNIKRIHNFFLTGSTKSSIKLNQSIGRGMRLHKDKDVMRYFDFIDDFSHKTKKGKIMSRNYVLKHSYERLNEYLENGYPIKELEVSIK